MPRQRKCSARCRREARRRLPPPPGENTPEHALRSHTRSHTRTHTRTHTDTHHDRAGRNEDATCTRFSAQRAAGPTSSCRTAQRTAMARCGANVQVYAHVVRKRIVSSLSIIVFFAAASDRITSMRVVRLAAAAVLACAVVPAAAFAPLQPVQVRGGRGRLRRSRPHSSTLWRLTGKTLPPSPASPNRPTTVAQGGWQQLRGAHGRIRGQVRRQGLQGRLCLPPCARLRRCCAIACVRC